MLIALFKFAICNFYPYFCGALWSSKGTFLMFGCKGLVELLDQINAILSVRLVLFIPSGILPVPLVLFNLSDPYANWIISIGIPLSVVSFTPLRALKELFRASLQYSFTSPPLRIWRMSLRQVKKSVWPFPWKIWFLPLIVGLFLPFRLLRILGLSIFFCNNNMLIQESNSHTPGEYQRCLVAALETHPLTSHLQQFRSWRLTSKSFFGAYWFAIASCPKPTYTRLINHATFLNPFMSRSVNKTEQLS